MVRLCYPNLNYLHQLNWITIFDQHFHPNTFKLIINYITWYIKLFTIIGVKMSGRNLLYWWLPQTAEETSNPLPTLPWAKQCTNWATLWISFFSGSVNWLETTWKWSNKAATSEVVKAAELPSPVLCTVDSVACVLQNGSKEFKASAVFSSCFDSSLNIYTVRFVYVKGQCVFFLGTWARWE